MEDFILAVLVEPNGVGVLADEFIDFDAVDGGRAADALLFAVDEDGHEIFFALFFCGALGGGEFFLWFGHGEKDVGKIVRSLVSIQEFFWER